MTCEHLRAVEEAILAVGIRETFRGQAWSSNCREWVYFDCYLDLPTIRDKFALADCVVDHIHRGTHDGQERGLVCMDCRDAIVGNYERGEGQSAFPGAEPWGFDQTPNTAVITTREIIALGKPVLRVSHDVDDHGWQFLSGEAPQAADAMVVALAEMLGLDPSLRELSDLPPGWQASREHVGGDWHRSGNQRQFEFPQSH